MKKILLIALVFLINGIYAQKLNKDTLIIIFDRFSSVQDVKCDYLYLNLKNDTLYLSIKKKKTIDEVKKEELLEDMWRINPFIYCKFIWIKNHRLIEEGYWNNGFFQGQYCSYFKNGSLKSNGNYLFGIEVGKWVYYKKDGTIYKIVYYPNAIKGMYDRSKARINLKDSMRFLYVYTTPQDSINFVKSVKGRWLRRYR